MANNDVRGRLTKAERTELTKRSDAKGLVHLAGHVMALVFTGVLIALRVPAWPAVLIVHGVVTIFLFTLLHETVHNTPFATEARVYVLGYALLLVGSIVTGSTLLVLLWLVPLALGQPFLRIYLLAEHGKCPFVATMLENTRTTGTNRSVRALAWNMPYHGEHHSYPAVPFHQLPRLHARLGADVNVISKAMHASRPRTCGTRTELHPNLSIKRFDVAFFRSRKRSQRWKCLH